MAVPKPDYLSRDYAGLKASLLQYASQYFPDWQPASEGDLGMVMAELFAYTGDILSYYTDRAQFENYISTATQRDSVLAIATLLGYVPNSGAPATGTVVLSVERGQSGVTVPAGTQILTSRIQALDAPVVFETDSDLILPSWPVAEINGEEDYRMTVGVTEGATVSYLKIGSSSGQPSPSFTLPNPGVYRDSIRVYVEDNTGTTQFLSGVTPTVAREWRGVDHLLNSNPTDQDYEVSLQDTATVITFGDDINGAIPGTGLQIFATYRYGFGAQGNVGEGLVRFIDSNSLAGVHVSRNTDDLPLASAMTGGTDAESTDSIRYNAPRAYRTQNRIVNKRDFADAALAIEGVSKANAVMLTSSSVTVFVAGPDGGIPSQRIKDRAQAALQSKALGGVTVSVAEPTFVPVNLGTASLPLNIEVGDQYSQVTTEAAIRRNLSAYIGTMAFGDRFSVGNIYDQINDVDGVRHAEVPVMARNDSAQSGVASIYPRDWEIFTPGTFYINMIGGVA